jgi:hypothetical protein
MEEKKRIAKGIKLNASQLPLTNKGDFVVGKDSRKVLDNKIIENLSGGSHGYFPSTLSNNYRTWSVSRELELPELPADAEADMRMIEAASAEQPLQNEFWGIPQSTFESYMADAESGNATSQQGTPASDPELAARLADTHRETLPGHISRSTSAQESVAAEDVPSPWGAPIADTQERYVVTSSAQQQPQQPLQQPAADSPWAGPEMALSPEKPAPGHDLASTQSIQPAPQYSQPESPHPEAYPAQQNPQPAQQNPNPVQQDPQPAQQNSDPVQQDPQPAQQNPDPVPQSAQEEAHPAQMRAKKGRSSSNSADAGEDSDLLPAWMDALVFDATVSSELQGAEASPSGEQPIKVELETFLSSIPDEEFVIDNETMRHLFSSLCEPKTTSKKIKSPASEAADMAIAAAAAEILKSEVSIDEISIEDMATQEMLTADGVTGLKATESEAAAAAELEAIQNAYKMLDLTPIPSSQRKDVFKSVYDVVEDAAEKQVAASAEEPSAGEQGSVARTERGTIEMATHVGGRQLVPTYNFCGMLTSVSMSDGLSFVLTEEKNTWHMIEQSGKVMVSGIQSVTFDKLGNLTYVTKRGDVVTLKIDGSIDTRFAKKGHVVEADGVKLESSQDALPQTEEQPQAEPESKLPSKLDAAVESMSDDAVKSKSEDVDQSKADDVAESKCGDTSKPAPDPAQPQSDEKMQAESAVKTQPKSNDKTRPEAENKSQKSVNKAQSKASKPAAKSPPKPKSKKKKR